jgi:hypothetical protein
MIAKLLVFRLTLGLPDESWKLIMSENSEDFYLSKEEPVKGCLLALQRIIIAQNGHMIETRKYGMPCFCYKKKIICYLWTDKNTGEPYILLADGQKLEHPALETGNRSRMKILRVNPEMDIPIEMLRDILQDAISFHGT